MSAPYTQIIKANAAAVGATADATTIIGDVPIAGVVSGITYTPNAAITGNTTDSRTLTVVNKGQSGTGTTVIGTLAFITGVNGVAYDEKAFTLSVVAGATAVVAEDVLALVSTHVSSTGLADPGGVVEVTIARSDSSA